MSFKWYNSSFKVHPHLLKNTKNNKISQKKVDKYPSERLDYKSSLERLHIIENEITLQCHEEVKEVDDSLNIEEEKLRSSMRELAINQINYQFNREEVKLQHYEAFFEAKLRCSEAILFRSKVHSHLMDCQEAAIERIAYLFDNSVAHRAICEKLLEIMVTQTLTWFNETYVILRVTKRDFQLAQKIIGKAQNRARRLMKKKIIVILDATTFLPPSTCGGVQAHNKNGTIFVKNTFSDRTTFVLTRHLPVFKQILFQNTMYSSRYPNKK